MPLLGRWTFVGTAVGFAIGAITGLVVGLLAYPPTAWFAVFEAGVPASVAGAVIGMGAGLSVLAARGIGRFIRRDAHPGALGGNATAVMARGGPDRLGAPEQVVAEARERPGIEIPRSSTSEWIAVGLLLAGGFLLLTGWVIGVVLLWSSPVWTVREKLIGTLLVPGGLTGGAWMSVSLALLPPGASPSTFVLRGVMALLLLIAPILTAIYLGRRIRRASPG